MSEDWSFISGTGPQDQERIDQYVYFEESETLEEPGARMAAASAPITATAYINLAKTQVGYREGPNNANKYGEWYGMNHQPYCAMGLTWVAAELSALPTIGGKWAYCPYWAHWARQQGLWSNTPQRGDIVFFDWTGQKKQGKEAHVGLVYEASGSSFKSVEFNTVAGTGNQSDGGGVFARSRSTSLAVGFFRPRWAKETAISKIVYKGHEILTVDGSWGAKTTRRLQEVLRVQQTQRMDAATNRALSVWLRQTPTTVMTPLVKTALQSRVGVKKDGVIGPGTVKALQRYLNRL